jgi:8-hydroxy-5-deazaflavin:NADPH oxidoreductase
VAVLGECEDDETCPDVFGCRAVSPKPTVGVIGSGPMGRGFAVLLSRAGYDVLLGTSHPDAPALAELPKAVHVGAFRDAAHRDVVFISIAHGATKRVLDDLRDDLAGKTLISSNNAWRPEDYRAAGLSPSITEGSWMAGLVPASHVVRAFSHIDWEYLVPKSSHPAVYAVSYAADDDASEQTVRELISAMGYVPYRVGTLAESAPLDIGGALWHYLFTPDQMRTTLAGTLTYSAGPSPDQLDKLTNARDDR